MSKLDKTRSFFSAEGPLSTLIESYAPRPGQIQMAEAISETFHKKHHLVVEAGTGVGKSLAYLVPALIEKQRRPVIVSTGTIALQEQLIEKDLPLLARALDRPLEFILAKGRGHYLCEHRFARFFGTLPELAEDEQELKSLQHLKTQLGQGIITRSNLINPISATTWSAIQSESGLCGQGKCKSSPCSYQKCRARLESADVIVVNHSLLFSHLRLFAHGASLLPNFEQLILDEAHHCPDAATEQFGLHLNTRSLKFFLDQLYHPRKQRGILTRLKPEPALLKKKVQELRGAGEVFFAALQFWRLNLAPENGRMRQPEPFEDPLSKGLTELSDYLGKWASSAQNEDEERELRYHSEKAHLWVEEIKAFKLQSQKEAAYWIEMGSDNAPEFSITARSAPLDVSTMLRELLFNNHKSIVMTSATLSTGQEDPFHYYKKRMGLEKEDVGIQVPSPFEYGENVVMISSKKFPSPKSERWEILSPKFIQRCIEITDGGAFVLVTSYHYLRYLFDSLEPWAISQGYQLLAQGLSGERSSLLTRFRSHPKSILIGNATFWEGVDIPGPSLRNVIIPRLPFEVPSHPLQEARFEDLEAKGGSPFHELSLPQAITKFKQGFGRLIRKATDLGLVCILDSRLQNKSYGKAFLNALPPCKKIIDELPDDDFLKRIENSRNQS